MYGSFPWRLLTDSTGRRVRLHACGWITLHTHRSTLCLNPVMHEVHMQEDTCSVFALELYCLDRVQASTRNPRWLRARSLLILVQKNCTLNLLANGTIFYTAKTDKMVLLWRHLNAPCTALEPSLMQQRCLRMRRSFLMSPSAECRVQQMT